MQRVLLATGAVLMLALAALWTVSFIRNKRMVSEAVMAAEAIPSGEAAGASLASLNSLQRLETLR